MTSIRIGTRASQLALWQSHFIRDRLAERYPGRSIEVIHFTTQGDRIIDRSLPEIGGKGLFTQELEAALSANEIDMAVHSLKDLPTDMPPAFTIGAIPARATPYDVLVSRDNRLLDELADGAVIGTSSLRRAAQIKAYRHDLQIRPIRGNVETRIRKTLDPQGEYDATILAAAGLERLGKLEIATQILDTRIVLPAPGQGALAVQCRADDSDILNLLAPLNDAATRACVTAERAFLQHLGSGCSLPVAAYATIFETDCYLVGRVNSLDGKNSIMVRGQAKSTESAALGVRLAERALAEGAGELLSETGETEQHGST